MSSALLKVALLWLALAILNGNVHADSSSRFALNSLFSTKTPYFWVKNNDEAVDEDSEFLYDAPGTTDSTKSCLSFHVSALIRHGIRYPGLKWIKRMDAVYEKLTKSAVGLSQKSEFIKNWSNPFPHDKEHSLAPLGQSELFALGKRFGQRYKSLFEEETDKIEYFISSKSRTADSRRAFHEGFSKILSADDDEFGDQAPVLDDKILRFHSRCKKFVDQIENNDTALGEYFKFKNGPEMNQVYNDVIKRIVHDDDLLNADDVITIHQICAFELSFFGKSDWCQYFEQRDMEVIDYFNDLKHYWQKAYGYKLSSDMSCPLVRHIFQQIDIALHDFEDGEDFTLGTFRFAHAETLAPVYAALGLYKDPEPLRANNFEKQTTRQFRSSKILPFAANLVFVLYECEPDVDMEDFEESDEENIYVKMFVNEEAVIIPACGEILCKYSDVRKYYFKHVDRCDFEKVCEINKVHDEL
ncbi:multiple inositol polyphosphate phosphatase 1-like [Argopecten irradians]|uniref:multiple inositol polyphosphate phosphatase 1-like n=1 Tax=Argopecten irradians TaxID=31199 RepID=UPI003710E620